MNVIDGAHYAFETIGSTYRFVFPYRKEWWRILSYGVSAAVVMVVVLPVSASVLSGDWLGQMGFETLLLFGVALFFGVGLALMELLWQVVGREVVEISDDALVIKHHILGLGPAKKFAPETVSRLQVSQQNEWTGSQFFGGRDYRYFNFKRGWVALNSGKSLLGKPVTYRFGTSLDEAEAGQVVAQILSRFPQYRAKPEN
jgi:hypothetical protein